MMHSVNNLKKLVLRFGVFTAGTAEIAVLCNISKQPAASVFRM
jgi:hypothetical protein